MNQAQGGPTDCATTIFTNVTHYTVSGGERGQHFDVDDHLRALGVATSGMSPAMWSFLQGAGSSHTHSAVSAELGMATPDLRIVDDMPGKESSAEFVLDSIAYTVSWAEEGTVTDTMDVYIVRIVDQLRFVQFRIHNGMRTLTDYEVRSLESKGTWPKGTNLIGMM